MLNSKIIPVSIFNKLVDVHLRDLGPVVVEGEISQLQISQGKWLFMTIKDTRASVGVFGAVFNLQGVDLLEEGMQVHVYGTAGMYQKTGRFNLNATKIVPAGEGALRLAYEKLKKKLDLEGLFDISRKRDLPRFPQKIGLITAKGSRAYGDFVKVLGERMGGIQIHFYPVSVQGDLSVRSLLRAFRYFQRQEGFDAVIMTRGGGSLEDLLSFNDEQVARAIFACKFPVVSAIGHEDDVALTDFVADVRASTPSNAAELLVKNRSQVLNECNYLVSKLQQYMMGYVHEWQASVDHQVGILKNYFSGQRTYFEQLFSKLRNETTLHTQKILLQQQNLRALWQKLQILPRQGIREKQQALHTLERLLQTLDYKQVLKRGFTMTRDENGSLVRSVQQLKMSDKITTVVMDGEFVSEVIEKK